MLKNIMQLGNKLFFIVIAFFASWTTSCEERASREENGGVVNPDSVKFVTTGMDLTPALQNVDSLVVLFYKDPFGSDPERYTRYYKQYPVTSDSLMPLLKGNLSKPFREDTLRDCRSEGKIYCFVKGKPVQTVYFTNQNDACHHLYIIHTGRYYYFTPDSLFEARLAKVKPLSVEP